MKPKEQPNTFPYILGSLALIVVAIVFTSILNKASNPQNQPTSVETHASAPGMVKVAGVVSKVDSTTDTITVTSLRFTDSTTSLGTWTVTPPQSFNMTLAQPGSTLIITVDPPTMIAVKRTLTALDIVVSR